jgi:quercetin dioxygenase-like cupin family protein
MEAHRMHATQATHVRWNDLPRERLGERLERRYVTGQHLTLAQFFLAKGCVVPVHEHESEQFANVLSGRLRFRLGANGAEVVEVAAGEVLLIPSRLPHAAEALEDSVVADAFSPVRSDWLEKRDDYLRR